MAYIPATNSVVGFQSVASNLKVEASIIGLTPVQMNVGTLPVSASNPVAIMPPQSGFLNVQVVNSVITAQQSSIYGTVTALQQAGSVMAVSGSFTPAANQSVSGTVVIEQLAGSVLAVSGSFTPPANQSVSGTVGIEQTAGSILAVSGKVEVIGSVAAAGGIEDPNNSSSVLLGAGSVFTGVGTDVSQYGTIYTNIFADKNSTANGMQFQYSQDGTNWNDNIAGGFDYIANVARRFQFAPNAKYFRVVFNNTNSAQGVFRLQTILTKQPQALTTIHRLDSDVAIDRSATLVKAGLIAQVNGSGDFTPIQANAAGILKIGGTVDQGTGWGSVAAHIKSGSVVAVLGGNTSVISLQGTPEWTVKSSIAGGIFPISGSVAVGNFPTSQNINGSVIAQIASSVLTAQIAGSIMAIGGTVTANQGTGFGSVASHIKSGSVISIGYVTRNDAVASVLGVDLTSRPMAGDSAGRTVVKPFAPEESRVEGYISLTSTSVTTLVAAGGAGIRNYITDIWVANTGSVTTLVTFKDGDGSVLGYTIAPATGGSNLPGLMTPIRTGANATFDIQASSPTSILYATVKGFKAP